MARDPVATVLTPAQRRRVILVVVVSQLVLALVTGTTVYAVWRHLDGNIEAGSEIPGMTGTDPAGTTAPDEPHEPLNVLVLGTDTRAGSGDSIDGEAGCDCSDTTILFHVSADRQSAYGVSIPRDALVEPVACTKDHLYYGPGGVPTGLVEWNSAYSIGEAPCTAEQIQDDFGVEVDDYVVIDFEGFKDMVSAIDGVDVCIPFELYDPTYTHADFKPGPSVHLDGPDSLKYVRLRHAYDPVTGAYTLDGTDPGRIKRQQTFVSAMIDKLFSESTLTRPDRLLRFATALTDSITTNPEIAHVGKLIDLAQQFGDIDLSHIRFVTLPSQNYGPGPYVNRVQVLPAAYRLMKRVANDEPLGKFARGSLGAGAHHRPPRSTKDANEAVGICS
jgi:LCP family protein required for cell wall assembly